MRTLPLLALLCLSLSAHAQSEVIDKDARPIPPSVTDTGALEPEVTITQQTETTIEEFRANGALYMIKITPKHGVPYYLVDERGDGKFARQDSLDSGLRVPRWIIKRF